MPADDGEGAPDGGDGAGDEASVTDDDLAVTVAAIRALDEEELAAEGDRSLAPEPALTVFGCNVPTGGKEVENAVTAGGDYLLAVAGLFGLIVARVRPGRNKKRRS